MENKEKMLIGVGLKGASWCVNPKAISLETLNFTLLKSIHLSKGPKPTFLSFCICFVICSTRLGGISAM